MVNMDISKLNELDRMRIEFGNDKFKSIISEMLKSQKHKIVKLLNDENLLFSSLFLLIPEIDKNDLYESLSERNKISLHVCAKIMKDEYLLFRAGEMTSDENAVSTLKWMFDTGVVDDGLSEEFDGVIDRTAGLIIRKYKDRSMLEKISELIFERYKKGHLIHDLVWVFFRAHNTESLMLIAEHIKSSDTKEADFACKLLNLNVTADKQKQYNSYISWLNENNLYLYFTDENFQSTSNPNPCSVDLKYKYLNKEISKPLSLNGEEQVCAECFNSVDEQNKVYLSKYSKKLHDNNPVLWSKWLQYPINEQIDIAKNGLGGML